MHKEYKQWERIFANNYVLAFLCVFIFTIFTLLMNIVLHFIQYIPKLIDSFKNFSSGDESVFDYTLFFKWSTDFQPRFFIIYLAMYLILTFFCALYIHKIRRAFKDINKGTKGTARFTTLEEIRETYKAVKDNDEDYEGDSGIPVTHYGDELYIDTNNTNTLVVASTQSGKTEMFSYPHLDVVMRAKKKDSIIITDIKGDMLKNTKSEFERRGYDVHVLNLLNPYQGIGYNPLELVKQAYIKGDYAKAQMLCNTLSYSLFHNPNAKDPMWENSSIALVNALILAVCDLSLKANKPENITMYTVTVMLSELGSDPDEDGYTKLDYFFGSLPANHPAKLQYATVQFSQGVTRSGIFTGTMAELKNYSYDTIARMTANTTFQIEDLAFGDRPIALFIVYPDWDDSNYSIISTFLSQVAAVLSEKATMTKDSKLPRRVRHLYEEVANIPAIEGLNRSLAVGLSRGLVYSLVVQNTAQLAEKYGEKMAESIMGNCGNQIYIMSDEMEDAEIFSKKLGLKTVVADDRSGPSLSLDKSFSEKEEERPLLMPDELRRLKKGEWVFIRTKKREDLKNNRVIPYPIFSQLKNGTQMLHRYEYLMHRFNNEVTFEELNLEANTKDIDLDSLLLKFEMPRVAESEEETTVAVAEVEEEESREKSFNTIQLFEKAIDAEDDLTTPNEQISPLGNNDLEDKGEDYFMENIEGVYESSTPILDVLTEDKYQFIKTVVKKNLSEGEYSYFEELGTVEEVKTFFEAPGRETLFKQIEKYLS